MSRGMSRDMRGGRVRGISTGWDGLGIEMEG